jgi:DNA-binding HxlR family transcriptional regulator
MMQELRGISPTTLTDTLQELQREDLVKRESFVEIPPRVEYSLTKDGAHLERRFSLYFNGHQRGIV